MIWFHDNRKQGRKAIGCFAAASDRRTFLEKIRSIDMAKGERRVNPG